MEMMEQQKRFQIIRSLLKDMDETSCNMQLNKEASVNQVSMCVLNKNFIDTGATEDADRPHGDFPEYLDA